MTGPSSIPFFSQLLAGIASVGIVAVLGYGYWQEGRSRASRDATEAVPVVVLRGDTLRADSAMGRVWVQRTLRQHRLPRDRPSWLNTGVRQAVADGLWMRDSVGALPTITLRVGMHLEHGGRTEQPYRFEREDGDTWRGVRAGAATRGGWPDTLMAHRREHPEDFPLPVRTSTVTPP